MSDDPFNVSPRINRYILEHGAIDRLQAWVWILRYELDLGWQAIADALNRDGPHRPDGKPWTRHTAMSQFGEPPQRR